MFGGFAYLVLRALADMRAAITRLERRVEELQRRREPPP